MDISKSEAIIVQDGDKLFICVETNEEGIADFRRSSKYGDLDVEICTMWVEGEKKPAFRFEVKDSEWCWKSKQTSKLLLELRRSKEALKKPL